MKILVVSLDRGFQAGVEYRNVVLGRNIWV